MLPSGPIVEQAWFGPAGIAAELRVPLPAVAVTRQLYQTAQAHGHGREDWTTGLFRTMRALGKG